MPTDRGYISDSNIVSFSEARQRRMLEKRPLGPATMPAPELRREVVLFVTGGTFECMVNGLVGPLVAGDFVRVPAHGACSIRDIGQVPGSILSHTFQAGLDWRFLRELAEALPPHSTAIPRADSRAFARLMEIAKRWGVSLDCGAAA